MTDAQIVTGALNTGDNVFAVGSVEGVNFTVKYETFLHNFYSFLGLRCRLRSGCVGIELPASANDSWQ